MQVKKIVFLASMAVLCFSLTAPAAPNLLDKMNDADWRALNIFFSNFCESHFGDFSKDAPDAWVKGL